jgi:hypothetical protein
MFLNSTVNTTRIDILPLHSIWKSGRRCASFLFILIEQSGSFCGGSKSERIAIKRSEPLQTFTSLHSTLVASRHPLQPEWPVNGHV